MRKEAQKKGKKKLRGDNERVRNGKNVCKLSFEIVTRQMAPRCQDLLAKSNFQASMASKIALYAGLIITRNYTLLRAIPRYYTQIPRYYA